eukprot:TRINITY_DN68051_c5_g1_i1.p1 TRINITY_DN68051_c5_g1~~TRINITY_DN68051_c5_g1_i1.p1  ORF type:complete len:435 (+),score=37.32 TRINITY_DN68051_c5_g1_i1:85-1389(+)
MTSVHRPQSASFPGWGHEAQRPQTSPNFSFTTQEGEFTAWPSMEPPSSRSGVKLPKAIQKYTARPQSTGGYREANKTTTLRPPLPNPESTGLMVEGMQTGQQVAVEATVVRVPSAATRPNSQQRERRSSDAHHNAAERERERRERLRDKALIRKLENEIKKLKGVIHDRDATIESLKAQLQTADQRCQKQADEFAHEAQLLKEKNVKLKKELEETLANSKEMKGNTDHWKSQLDLEKNKASLREADYQRSINELQAKIRDLEREVGTLERSQETQFKHKREADKQKEDIMRGFELQLGQEREKTAKALAELRQLKEKQEKDQSNVTKWRDTITKYNEFIQKICQPQFSVVKDESLTPVNPNGFNVVEGHVLVPLVLLLEGYSLLPNDLRETYNQTDYTPPTATTNGTIRPGSATPSSGSAANLAASRRRASGGT